MFKIDSFSFENPLVLAPMAGITDAVFRELCREQGASYTLAEMVASKKSLWDSKKSSTRHASNDEPEPRAIQLIGTEPDELAEAAVWQVSQGAQIIDLNLGCPAKKVCSVAAGSALMSDPARVEAIFDAVVSAVAAPVTVKMRTGSDDTSRNALQIAELAQHKGLQAVTIHGRTRADKFSGHAEYDTIRAVKQAVTIPVIANGDICTPQQAHFVLEYTAADAVMIGRASQGYPWIFRDIIHYLNHGEICEPPSLQAFHTMMERHLLGLYQLYGEQHGVRIARKHVGWYCQHLPQGQQLRRAFNQLNCHQAQVEQIHGYFQQHGVLVPESGKQQD